MSIFLVSHDRYLKNNVDETIADQEQLGHLRTFDLIDDAERAIERERRRGNDPQAIILDPSAKESTQAPGAKPAVELLNRLVQAMPNVPVILAISSAGTEFDIAAILKPQVWGWDMTPDRFNTDAVSQRLVQTLRTAMARPIQRCLRVTVSFDRDSERLSISENGVPHFRDRQLLKDGPTRKDLHDYAKEDFEQVANDELNIHRTLNEFGKVGRRMLLGLFGDVGQAMLERSTIDTIEFCFEFHPDVLKDLFDLPLELLSHDQERIQFLCRLRPMARRIGAARAARAAQAGPPHILFLDGGAASGSSKVLDDEKMRLLPFKELKGTAAAQYEKLTDLARSGHCTAERLDAPSYFSERPDERPSSASELLRRRLQEPRPDEAKIDVLHFCGHGITPRGGASTRLVLPGNEPGTIELLSIDLLARWLPDGVRLVFLGACQSVSVATAMHLHAARQCDVIGFRWKIRADRTPKFVASFYRAHLAEKRAVAAAYRVACDEAASDQDTVWLAAMALVG